MKKLKRILSIKLRLFMVVDSCQPPYRILLITGQKIFAKNSVLNRNYFFNLKSLKVIS